MAKGIVIEVIAGLRKGYFGQVDPKKQTSEMISASKVFVDYFDDLDCTLPSIVDGKPLRGITNYKNIKNIGFYD